MRTTKNRIETLIKKIENENISEKAWNLKGEIDAKSRPNESLLEKHLLFDYGVVKVPEITADFTKIVEHLILQRIKDKTWDDVERKIASIDQQSFRKKIKPVSGEKSKEGLAEVYEKSYLSKVNKINSEEETKEIAEIRKELHSVIFLLDALTNQRFVPDINAPIEKVIKNQPALKMEDIIPLHTSEYQTLAPEEISKPVSKLPLAQSEKDQTYKNNIRRKKKSYQRRKFQDLDKRNDKNIDRGDKNKKVSKIGKSIKNKK